ncbi:MAG: 4Fe-4S binding protein, partial [Planctomycetota bacterium]
GPRRVGKILGTELAELRPSCVGDRVEECMCLDTSCRKGPRRVGKMLGTKLAELRPSCFSDRVESPWDDREKYPIKFDLDELRCIFCGMCEEACPVDAIELTPAYDIVGLTRNEMIFDKAKLLSVYDATVEQKPM